MAGLKCDVLVVGGGLGGVAAALAVAESGHTVVLTEETKWIGGQLTSQAVPPDEHPWIEKFGCTRRYRELRNRVREHYRSDPTFQGEGDFNPGSGWVSGICASPKVWFECLTEMLDPHLKSGRVRLMSQTVISGGAQLSGFGETGKVIPVEMKGDQILRVALEDLRFGGFTEVEARYFIDATELGDLVGLSGAEHVTGSEALEERHGSGAHRPDNQQALTWVFAMSYDPGSNRVIDRPASYEFWRSFQPDFWPNALFDLQDLDPVTNQARTPALPLFSNDWRCWFKYRQIHDPSHFNPPQGFPTTVVNWPQNDYFLGEIINVTPELRWQRLQAAKEQSRCLLYWLQTECPHPDGGTGYPGLFASSDYLGSQDGFALTPYIRESRRIVARETILEQMVSAEDRPVLQLPPTVQKSVGIGSYRIDLHPSTGGDAYIDLATLPFQIPLGSMIPVRVKNLIPACKNIGTTHITNGCYRMHPVEWNIGEVAGHLATFCLESNLEPSEVLESGEHSGTFIALIQGAGVETEWPRPFLAP